MRSISFILCSLVLSLGVMAGATGGAARAGMLAPPGPNPSWTDMQQFEWYLGYMARAAHTCGTYQEAAILRGLARMSPYGDSGLGSITGDGFAGPVCGGINNEAKELAADADRIREYLEATYECTGEECYGKKLTDWEFHTCGNSLKSQFEILDLDRADIRKVTMINPAKTGSDAAHQARVQFHSCQGSLYIDLTEQCVLEKTQTRGDCELAGIERY